MIINIDSPDNKEFFRIKKILDELRNSDDYNKDRIILLTNLAKKLMEDIKINTDDGKITANRFSGTKIVNSKMTEAEVLSETYKAIEEQFNLDIAIENLTALVRFWKNSSKEKDVYEPLLKEIVEVLDDTQVYLEQIKKVEDIKKIMKGKEDIILSLQNEKKGIIQELDIEKFKVKKWKDSIQPLLNNLNIVKSLLDFKNSVNQLTTPHLGLFSDVVVYLILEGGKDGIPNIAEGLGVTQELIMEVQRLYVDFLELSPSGEMIGIVPKEEYDFNIEEYLEEIEHSKKPNFKLKTKTTEKITHKELGEGVIKEEVKEEIKKEDAESEEVKTTKSNKGKK